MINTKLFVLLELKIVEKLTIKLQYNRSKNKMYLIIKKKKFVHLINHVLKYYQQFDIKYKYSEDFAIF